VFDPAVDAVRGTALGEGLADGAPVTSAATRFTVTASTACAPGGSFVIPVRCAAYLLSVALALLSATTA